MAHRILLADDSLTIQKVVELTFSDAGHELLTVGNGDRAVEALRDFHPDIVLADVVMPGLNGYDVCEAVKRQPDGAFIPVILLTGTFEPFDRARAERVGCDSIVTKPFDSHALASLVNDLVAKAAAARQAPPPPAPAAAATPAAVETAVSAPVPPKAADEPTPPSELMEFEMVEAAPGREQAEAEEIVIDSEPEREMADEVTLRLPRTEEPEEPTPAVTAAEASAPEPEPGASPEPEIFALPAEEPASAGAVEQEIPPMPPSLGPDSDDEEEEPVHRDLDEDIAAFERSGKATTRPELWDRMEAAASKKTVPAEPASAPPAAAGELEALAAKVSLTDLQKSIPPAAAGPLSDADVDRIARRVVEILGDRAVQDVVWEVVPEMAERLIRARIQELERVE